MGVFGHFLTECSKVNLGNAQGAKPVTNLQKATNVLCQICEGKGFVETKCTCDTCSTLSQSGRMLIQCGKMCPGCLGRRCLGCQWKGYVPCSDCGGSGKLYSPCQCVMKLSQPSLYGLDNQSLRNRQVPAWQFKVPHSHSVVQPHNAWVNGRYVDTVLPGGNVVRTLRSGQYEQRNVEDEDLDMDDDDE